MITHKQQHPAYYLLLLVAFICCINVPLQTSEDPKKDALGTWVEKEIKQMMDDENTANTINETSQKKEQNRKNRKK